MTVQGNPRHPPQAIWPYQAGLIGSVTLGLLLFGGASLGLEQDPVLYRAAGEPEGTGEIALQGADDRRPGSVGGVGRLPRAGAVVPVALATTSLPGDPGRLRSWLAESGLVHELVGEAVVIWDDVLAAIRGDEKPLKPPIPRGAIVSEDRAARALPWRRRDAVAWLRRRGLSVIVDARRVVAWDEVLVRLRPRPQAQPASGRSGSPPHVAKPGRILD